MSCTRVVCLSVALGLASCAGEELGPRKDATAHEPTGADSHGQPDDGDSDTPPADNDPDPEPLPPRVRFIAIGDSGTGEAEQYEVAASIATHCADFGCDFVLYLGDNFYPGGVQ